MSTRAQRGREIRKRANNPMRIVYIILGVAAVVGVAVVGYLAVPKGGSGSGSGSTVAINPSDLSSYPSKGKADAPVTVIEYADLQCPACAAFATQSAAAFDKLYVDTGKVRFIYHDFPLPQHINAVPAASAARCAGEQNAFWQMAQLLFANQSQWESRTPVEPQFLVYADQLKLDKAAFQQCVSSNKYREALAGAAAEAGKAGINATPTFVIDGKSYTADKLDGAIKAALAAKGVQ
jgi:protein-disulfide isomerase